MSEDVEAVRVDLKYCEACGALWLRPRNSRAPYCRRCEKIIAELSHGHGGKPAEGRRS